MKKIRTVVLKVLTACGAFAPARVNRSLVVCCLLLFGFQTMAAASPSEVRLDDIQLSAQVGKSEEIGGQYGVFLSTSIRVDEEIPDDRMYVFIWHFSNHQGFEPNSHTLLLLDLFPFHYGEGRVVDEHGSAVLHASHVIGDYLLPGLTYYAKAHVVAVHKNDFDQDTQTFRASSSSDYSDEVSFILPSPIALRRDMSYFLIDNYYRSSDDEYALVEENEELILYLQVTTEPTYRWFGEGDAFVDFNLGPPTPRPVPEIGDVVIFAQDLYHPQFMRNPVEVTAIDDTSTGMLRLIVKQLPRYQVIDDDFVFQLKIDTATGHAEMGFSNDTDGKDEEEQPVNDESGLSPTDGRFIAYDNGTVLDTRTNLMWAAKDNGADINWADARSYSENYRAGGYTDWRMPTRDELEGLYDRQSPRPAPCNPGHNIHVVTDLIDITCFSPWASEVSGTRAGIYNFAFGGGHWHSQTASGFTRALPVRSGK